MALTMITKSTSPLVPVLPPHATLPKTSTRYRWPVGLSVDATLLSKPVKEVRRSRRAVF
jgi:hypothetical protein